MNSKATWFLLALVGALLAFILAYERPAREARNHSNSKQILPELQYSNVLSIEVITSNRVEILAERTNGNWRLRKPLDYPANAQFIQILLTNLANVQWLTHITSEELASRTNVQEEFGMVDPQFTLRIKDNTGERELLIGHKSVMANEVFVQTKSKDGLFLVDADWLRVVPRRAEDWRDPSMLPADISQITAVDVRTAQKGFRLEVNPTNLLWRMTRPIEARANHGKVNDLLSNLNQASIAAYVDAQASADLDLFGLGTTFPPQLELTFFRGTNILMGLQVGTALTNSPEHLFARHTDRDSVFVVPKEAVTNWMAPHVEFRDRRLVRFGTNEIETIAMKGSETFTVRKDADGKWSVSNGTSFSPDPESLGDLLGVLSGIEVAFENDVVTDFNAYGLTNPIVEITVSARMTNAVLNTTEITSEQLRFGTNDSSRVFVRRNEESRIYSIHPEEFALMPKGSWQMADKQIWNFKANDVVSVTIEQHGKQRKLLRNGTNDWSVAPGSQGIINPFLLEEAVYRMGNLKAVFWTAKGDPNDDRYGFKKTDLKVTFEVRGNDGKTMLLPVSFGDFSPFKLPYAKTVLRGETIVFEFPLPLYLEFVRRDLSIVPAPLPPQ